MIELELAETDPERARAAAEDMARRLLANTVIESFRVSVDAMSRLASKVFPLPLREGDGGRRRMGSSAAPSP